MIQVHTRNDVARLGTILGVWAHPDDETFTCAGIMATASQNGQRVVCVTATKGEAGVQDESRWPAAQLGDIRSHELMNALTLLGISDHHFLGYRDGDCATVPLEEGVAQVAYYIEHYQPDSLLIFGPDGMTGHPDHIAVGNWARGAVDKLQKPLAVYEAVETNEKYEQWMKEADQQFNIYFNIDKPPLFDEKDCDIYYVLPEDICHLKCEALAAMPSQTEALLRRFPRDVQLAMFGSEAFKIRGSV